MYGWKHQLRIQIQAFLDYWLWLWKYRGCELERKSFELGGRAYRYFVHPYNHTWANERAVEIPVVRELVARHDPGAVLEIGNVLSHYFPTRHAVLDKYERSFSRPIIRDDVVSYRPEKPYELIVSISTVEHVGWDEQPRNPRKALEVFSRIEEMLAPGARAVLTLPVGYNTFLDQCLRERRLTASSIRCMKRISAANEWTETHLDDACCHRYGQPFGNANALIFFFMEDPRPTRP